MEKVKSRLVGNGDATRKTVVVEGEELVYELGLRRGKAKELMSRKDEIDVPKSLNL